MTVLHLTIQSQCRVYEWNDKSEDVYNAMQNDGFKPYISRPRYGGFGKRMVVKNDADEDSEIRRAYDELKRETLADHNKRRIVVIERKSDDINLDRNDEAKGQIYGNHHQKYIVRQFGRKRHVPFQRARFGNVATAGRDASKKLEMPRPERFGDLQPEWGRFGKDSKEVINMEQDEENENSHDIPLWPKYRKDNKKESHAETRWGRPGREVVYVKS